MKILEAAAMSMPVITTTVGVEGLKFKHRESCFIADTPQEFAKAIELLSSDSQLSQSIGEKANEIFKAHCSKEVLAEVRNWIYTTI